jgi:hypothetical protein
LRCYPSPKRSINPYLPFAPLIYRWYFRAHGARELERSSPAFAGIAPVRETLLRMVDAAGDASGGLGSTGRETTAGASLRFGRHANNPFVISTIGPAVISAEMGLEIWKWLFPKPFCIFRVLICGHTPYFRSRVVQAVQP